MTRALHWINALLVIGLVIGSLLAWPELPERIPGHFAADGTVTRWDEPSVASWFLLPGVALALVAFTYGLAALLPGRPHLFNSPDQARILALPPHRRAPVIERMQDMLYGVSSLMLVIFGVIQWSRWETAHGADSRPFLAAILIIAFLSTPLVLAVWLPRIQAETERQVREEKEGSSMGPG